MGTPASYSPLIIDGFLGCGIKGHRLLILRHFQFCGQQAAHFRCQLGPFARQFFLQLCNNKLFMIRHCLQLDDNHRGKLVVT